MYTRTLITNLLFLFGFLQGINGKDGLPGPPVGKHIFAYQCILLFTDVIAVNPRQLLSVLLTDEYTKDTLNDVLIFFQKSGCCGETRRQRTQRRTCKPLVLITFSFLLSSKHLISTYFTGKTEKLILYELQGVSQTTKVFSPRHHFKELELKLFLHQTNTFLQTF